MFLCRLVRYWLLGGAIQAEAREYRPFREVGEMDVVQDSQIYAILSITTMADEDEAFCREKRFELPWGPLRDLAEVGF